MAKPVHVAFVWHMHQPYYKDDLTSTYLLPWVRLRSAKDYYKMPALLDGYPKLRATFNLVPSLLAQIEDYGKEESVDLFLNLSRRAAADLSAEEHDFLLRWMRDSPRALRVQQSPRYLELASRPADAQFTTQDIRDLQVWFNLAWCDPVWMETDPRLAELKRKDRDFSEADKQPLFTAQLDMMAKVIPKYRELADRGQVELTFSPYYHPILPLLSHVDSARIANSQIQLPEHHFSHREDAERQISLGMGLFERLLGRRPTGMWPSEMAVGESVVDLVAGAGVGWMISDEEVLARSMENRYSRDEHLYSPKRIEREGQSLTMVFRDSQISNAIGFDYQRMSSIDAARALVGRLRRIGEQQGERDLLVVIALDGENAWEFYPRDGHDFLNALYTEAEAQDRLKDAARAALAWREILITEGSDWFWWFSRKHDSGMDQIWDNQFRLHLRNVYKLMGQRAPARLFQPIIERASTPERGVPSISISPSTIHDPVWSHAGYYLVGSGFGALHRPAGVVERVFYGSDHERLYFRIDTPRTPAELEALHIEFWVYCSGAPAADGQGSLDLPLPISAAAELGFYACDDVYVDACDQGGAW